MKGLPFFEDAWAPGNRKATIILLLAPWLLITFKYAGAPEVFAERIAPLLRATALRSWMTEAYVFGAAVLFLGIIPLLVVKGVFRESLGSYGVALGDWRYGLKWFLVLAPVFVVSSYLASKEPAFIREYPIDKGVCLTLPSFGSHALRYLCFYLSWEFFFRGFMQSGLEGRFGTGYAILMQTLASALVHIGKPPGEIYGSILAGLAWGVIVAKSRSLLAVVLMHWLLGVSLDFFLCRVP